MALAIVYDPRGHTWDSWASLMVEAYAGQNIMIPSGENHWKEWASNLKNIDIFTSQQIPGPLVFNNWQDWAQAVVGAVNQKVE